MPDGEPKLRALFENFGDKFIPYALAAGVPQAECDAFKVRLTQYRATSVALEQDRATMQKRTTDQDTERGLVVAILRAFSNRIKAAPGGEAAAKDLQVLGSADVPRPVDAVPVATVAASPQGPVVDFTNPTRQGVNVYRQIIGTDPVPRFLARDTRSPYIDTEAFAKAENLAYFVIGVKSDAEVGQASATVTLTYGGGAKGA